MKGPYAAAQPVVCLDEQPIALHADVRSPIPAKPGKPAKQDNEYERCGAEFARMVGHVVQQYPFAKTIHLVMDNLNSHTRNSLINCYGEQEGGYLWDRLTVHYTPKHGSWLNQAEIELSMYSRQCLGKRRFPDVGTLRRETTAWNRTTNGKRTKINWRFTRRKARKVFRYAKPRRAE
jgi:transposase